MRLRLEPKSDIRLSDVRAAPMVALEAGTVYGVSWVQPRGRQFGRGVGVGRGQRGDGTWHGNRTGRRGRVCAADSPAQSALQVALQVSALRQRRKAPSSCEHFICGMRDLCNGGVEG